MGAGVALFDDDFSGLYVSGVHGVGYVLEAFAFEDVVQEFVEAERFFDLAFIPRKDRKKIFYALLKLKP